MERLQQIYTSGLELRAEPEGVGTVEGVVVRYGDVAKAFNESIEVGAFGDLSNADVRVNFQHDRAQPLARTGAGLSLLDAADALRASIALPDTTLGRDTAYLVRSGVLQGLSSEMLIDDYAIENGLIHIRAAQLVGIAVVDKPAYPDSRIGMRANRTHRWNPITL